MTIGWRMLGGGCSVAGISGAGFGGLSVGSFSSPLLTGQCMLPDLGEVRAQRARWK